MNNIYLHLLSDFPACFKIIENGKVKLALSSQECLADELNIELINISDFSISVYPITSKGRTELISYVATFKILNEKLITESEYVKEFTLPENNYILKFMPLSVKNQTLSADKIELVENKVKKLTFLNDIAGRAKVEVLSSSEKSLQKEEEYFVYVNNENNNIVPDELLLLSFFESLLAKDFSSAKKNLSPDFSEKLSKDTLKDFFGSFTSCHIVNYFDQPTVALFYEDKINSCAVFGSNIFDGKITDIYEINE